MMTMKILKTQKLQKKLAMIYDDIIESNFFLVNEKKKFYSLIPHCWFVSGIYLAYGMVTTSKTASKTKSGMF